MNRLEKVGEGSYGVVYSATFKDDETNKVYAVKRNFKELSANWFGNIHEADLLIRLKGHPFIVELHRIALGDPFDKPRAMTPTVADKRRMAEDKMHFILEYAGTCGDNYLRSSNFSYANSKIILTQVAIAMEYMHDRMIIHRDLKPANILMDFTNGIPYSKVCDFGMSCNYSCCDAKTPGVVTCWYRAPEICYGHDDYDYKSDIWSFGCLMFEFITKEPWLVGVPDEDSKIMNTILSRLEEPPSEEDLEYLRTRGKNLKINTRDIMKRRLSYESQLNLRPSQKMEFEKYCGKLKDFVDLMRKCLQINPQKRISSKELLEHPFFNFYRQYINNVRDAYFNSNRYENQVIISKCIERKWAVNVALNVYNNRNDIITKRWYLHSVLFHAINLFERYLFWAFQPENYRVEIRSEESHNQGRLFNKQETELRFWVCLYLMHKYHSTLVHPKKWSEFCPSHLLNKDEKEAEDFEYQLLKHACNYKVFQETILEYADRRENLTEERIFKILSFYVMNENYIGKLDGLYKLFKESVGEIEE